MVAEMERRLSIVDELEAVTNANFQRVIRLRQSLLQQAFDGRLLIGESRPEAPLSPAKKSFSQMAGGTKRDA